VGALCSYVAFLIGRRLAGSAAGLAAAALLAASPLNIMESRHLGAPWMYEEVLQLVISWLVLQLHDAPSGRLRVALPVVVGASVWSGNQMMATVPLLAYGVVAGTRERSQGASVGEYLRLRYLTAWWVLPSVSTALLAYDAVALRRGHLFHALFEKRHELGWYGQNWWQDLKWALGNVGVWFAVLGFVLFASGVRRLLSLQLLPLVAFVVYTAPFLLTIPPGSTFTRGYIVHGVNALLLLTAVAYHRAPWPRVAAYLATGGLCLLLLLGAGESAYGWWKHPLLGTRNFHGTYVANVGFKAAAEWVRRNARPGDRVFSDAAGGAGLEPPLVAMYFDMPYYALYDAPQIEPYRRFAPRARDVTTLVVQAKNRGLVTRHFGPEFREAAVVSTAERGEVLRVFDRRHEGPPDRVLSVEADPAFDAKYSLLCP